MSKGIVLIVRAIFACTASLADVVYEHSESFELEDGVFSPSGFPETRGESRLSFSVRELKSSFGERKNGHWGFDFVNARGERGKIFSSGRGLRVVLSSPLGKSIIEDSVNGQTVIARKDGADEKWTKVTVESSSDGFVAMLDDEICRSERHSVLPFSKFKFSAYNRHIEIRDVRLEELPKLVVRRVERPTFVHNGVIAPGTYAVTNVVSSSVGGIMFWTRFRPGTSCVKFLGNGGRVLADFYCCGDFRIQANFALRGTNKPLVFKRRLFEENTRGPDDFHYAFTWREDGSASFLLNGIPFAVGLGGDDAEKPVTGNLLDGVTHIVIEPSGGWIKPPQEVSDVRIYHRELTNREVLEAYRARMPVDVVIPDSVLDAGKPQTLAVTVAPGGTYRLPAAVEGFPITPATVDVEMRVRHVDGAKVEFKAMRVEKPLELKLPELALPRGRYCLDVTVKAPDARPLVRTETFSVRRPVSRPSVAPSKDAWSKAELLWSRDFRAPSDMPYSQGNVHAVNADCGVYLEGGDKGDLGGDRMSTILGFPQSAVGHPCLLEIEWPDDKPRVMGLYVYAESTKTPLHRDRLQGGIDAGDVLKNTGRMQTSEYLFYPSSTNHLFEVRTMAEGRPAAITSLKVWRLAEPLPVLKVHHPEGLPFRRFGHCDEDQTFHHNFNDRRADGEEGMLEEFLRYFAYTGQSAFSWTILRYNATLGANEFSDRISSFASGPGELPWFFRCLNENDILTTGRFFLMGEPHIARLNTTECNYIGRGFVWLDDEGGVGAGPFKKDGTPNMANPDLQKLFFLYCRSTVQQFATCGMKAVDIPVAMLGSWPDLKTGYDDWTWNRFLSETGVSPGSRYPEKAVLATDYHARYDYLTSRKTPELRKRWIAWRAEQTTRFFSRFVRFVHKVAPGVEVRLVLPSGGEKDYVERGIDVSALAKIENVALGYSRGYTKYWWDVFRSRNPSEDEYRGMYDPEIPGVRAIRGTKGSARVCQSAASYFETFRGSSLNERFKTYFQNADVKPWGRNFLREPAFMVGVLDALEYLVGNQPVGTLGSEDVTREFIQAYSALPAMPFKDVGIAEDVVCRQLATKNGTYFYLVNLTDGDRRASLVFTGKEMPEAVDLSTDRIADCSALALKPYELRSFLIGNGTTVADIKARKTDK